ncbi:hypothetical protein VTI74DRAFT_651 [Chaetomium olivicolor]
MKRNDPVTRRFVQYAAMRPDERLILLRDGKDGRIITAPGNGQLWITRSRRGVNVVVRDGPAVSPVAIHFDSHFAVYIRDFAPGKQPLDMCHHLRELLIRARKIRGNRGLFAHMKYIMETLIREDDTKRVRQIEPGELVQSLYDEMCGPNARFWVKTPNIPEAIMTTEEVAPGVTPCLDYNDTDAAEDAILFVEVPRTYPLSRSTTQYGGSRHPVGP